MRARTTHEIHGAASRKHPGARSLVFKGHGLPVVEVLGNGVRGGSHCEPESVFSDS